MESPCPQHSPQYQVDRSEVPGEPKLTSIPLMQRDGVRAKFGGGGKRIEKGFYRPALLSVSFSPKQVCRTRQGRACGGCRVCTGAGSLDLDKDRSRSRELSAVLNLPHRLGGEGLLQLACSSGILDLRLHFVTPAAP
ncbi:Hypothetical predicted protein [Marmota monax]|uniref:Uncharacterized protein n=1 Tax=Marmota monax TaxID=9995 RepID=A0A5E4A3I4_MARMO|nr:Hypothetical predicted protein [Marmota monax]